MDDLPDSHQDALERHAGEGEQIQAATTSGSTTSAVSGRRFYQVTRDRRTEPQIVDSVSLDAVTSVHVERHPDEKPDYGMVGVGGLLGAVGLGIGGYSGQLGDMVSTVAMVSAGLLFLVGLLIAASGMSTEDGHVDLRIRTPSDELTETYELTDYFPETVSQQVADR